jgi:hypothetical protein
MTVSQLYRNIKNKLKFLYDAEEGTIPNSRSLNYHQITAAYVRVVKTAHDIE